MYLIIIIPGVIINISIVPSPVNVSVSHDDRIIAGSSFNLTCTVVLSPLVDVSVNVTTKWTGPNGTVFNPQTLSQPTIISKKLYTSTANVNAARNDNYTCQATISPKHESAEFIIGSDAMMGSATVTVGKYYIISVLECRLTSRSRGKVFKQL